MFSVTTALGGKSQIEIFFDWIAYLYYDVTHTLFSSDRASYGNMMTGNTIKLMDHLAAGRWPQASYPASLVPAYILGASICTWLNKVDLSNLGLGGPSQEAFSHLNPPRRLRSPQQIAVLRVVAIVSVVLFILGEFFGFIISGSSTSRWRLPFFACAFGLINAATLAAIHVVTNAVTG
jgi:hypothetical protein